MSDEQFDVLVAQEWKRMPERFLSRLDNVALLIEDGPSEEIRIAEGLEEGDTLLGIYQGIALVDRGSEYGVGMTLPDTITLFRLPISEEAKDLGGTEEHYRHVIRETIWHEVGHYFGLTEEEIHGREMEGTNRY